MAKLKQYGVLIPEIDYVQTDPISDRITNVVEYLSNWAQKVGYFPEGIMSFQPDTLVANYLYQKLNITYIQGYCFDQYAIDYMTMRGGWQMPYYANESNILVPSKTDGIIVLPHATWDWLESFRVSHALQCHPMNLVDIFNGNVARAKDYFLSLVDNSLAGSQPFGYVTFQFEWAWACAAGATNYIKDWITSLLSSGKGYCFWTFEDTAKWFTTMYQSTPTYRVDFVSPYSGDSIEWYYDKESRLARIGDDVVSYVDYAQQSPDRYLTMPASVIFPASKTDPNNCVDNSLEFTINSLGGAPNVYPITTAPYPYSGNLADFAQFYTKNPQQ